MLCGCIFARPPFHNSRLISRRVCLEADCAVAPRGLGTVERFISFIDQRPEFVLILNFLL